MTIQSGTQPTPLTTALQRFQRLALIVGVVGLALFGATAALGVERVVQTYLFAFFFWICITLGALLVLFISIMGRGTWGLMLQRLLEAGVKNIPLMAVFFLPILLGMNYLFPWLDPVYLKEHYIVANKVPYLNLPFFLIRAVLYFVIWAGMAIMLTRLTAAQEQGFDENLLTRMRYIAGPGLLVLVLTWTFASTDWGMSTEPEWFSSMYPVTFIAGMMIMTFSFGIIALSVMIWRKVLPYNIPVDRQHDLGKFLFAMVCVWAYINFSQFLIIYSGHVPELTLWYAPRIQGGWEWLSTALLFGGFIFPFVAMISRYPKRNWPLLTTMAIWLMVMEFIFVFWQIMPTFKVDGERVPLYFPWQELLAWVGMGGIWLGLWARNLAQLPILPKHDDRLQYLEEHDHGHAGHEAAKAHH